MLRLVHPVIAVIADGADQLVLGNTFLCRLQVVDKPVLRRYWPRCAAGVMFVVVHHHDTINTSSHGGVVEVLVARLHTDVELHTLGMQVLGKLL